MISRFEFLGVFAAALLLLQTPMSVAAPATPPAADDAVAFISNLADDALNMLGAEDMSADQRLTTFEKLVRKDFDLRLIGRVALGRHWRRASKEQKSEYLDLFSTHVLRTYSSLLSSYSDEKIEIGGAKPAGKKDMWVDSTILRASAPPVKVGWRVRQVKDRLRVIDVKVEGISMVQTQREEYTAVVQSNGIDGLLDMLRTKVSSEPAPA